MIRNTLYMTDSVHEYKDCLNEYAEMNQNKCIYRLNNMHLIWKVNITKVTA